MTSICDCDTCLTIKNQIEIGISGMETSPRGKRLLLKSIENKSLKYFGEEETDMKENEKWAVLRCSVEDMKEIQKAIGDRYTQKWKHGCNCDQCLRIKTTIADLLTVEGE